MKSASKKYIEKICSEIESLPADALPEKIAETARRLTGMHYQPILLLDVPDFLNITKPVLLKFVHDIARARDNLTEPELSLLIYQFRTLQALRRDEPEAWDEVYELMEDD
ncbi:MAG: hypothetical protein WC959_01180 [Kiritimatiellales bacterium]